MYILQRLFVINLELAVFADKKCLNKVIVSLNIDAIHINLRNKISMNALSHIFKLTSFTALVGWIILAALPSWSAGTNIVIGIVVALLCFAYTYLIFFGRRHDEPDHKVRGSFFSLVGIINLFKTPRVVLAGWVHYLAFDLMVGVYIVTDAAQFDISHWLLLPCLFMTLMFGPAGLLLYFILRYSIAQEYFIVMF